MKPTNVKALRSGKAGPFENRSTRKNRYLTEMTFGNVSSELRAAFASAGYIVYDRSNNDYYVYKADLGMTRYCRDDAELVAFAHRLGVINHG